MRWTKIHGIRGNSPEQMWDKLYRKEPNLDIILSGDQSRVTALRVQRKADDGHVIHRLLSDHTSDPVLRLMRFIPEANRIEVLTWDVKQGVLIEDTTYVHDRTQHQFSLALKLTP